MDPKRWQEIWQEFAKLISVSEDRTSFSYGNGSFVYASIIAESVDFLRHTDPRTKKIVIMQAIKACVLNKENLDDVAFDDFIIHLKQSLESAIHSAWKRYYFLGRINIPGLREPLDLSFRNSNVLISSEAHSDFQPIPPVEGISDINIDTPYEYVPFYYTSYSKSLDSFVYNADVYLSALCGILNGLAIYDSVSNDPKHRLHFIQLSPYQLAASDSKQVFGDLWWHQLDVTSDKFRTPLSKSKIDSFKRLHDRIRDTKFSKDLLYALSLFHSSGLQNRDEKGILLLWNCLEVLFSDSFGTTNSEIICHRAAFLDVNRKQRKAKLLHLSYIRNKYVHESSQIAFSREIYIDCRDYIFQLIFVLTHEDYRNQSLIELRRVFDSPFDANLVADLVARQQRALAILRGKADSDK